MARGDRIYVYREFINLEGAYKHYGIDCGDGNVIHYRKPSETIERTTISTFARGNKVYLIQENKVQFSFLPDIVVHRAESRLGERKYNLLFNNCEHFASWCKTGISESKQISNFLPAIELIDTHDLYQPLKMAFKEFDSQNNARRLLNRALADIKVLWDEVQSKYNNATEEIDSWHQVAAEAMRRDREDLARVALKRKLKYKQKAGFLKEKLNKLADMTETLLRNSNNL